MNILDLSIRQISYLIREHKLSAVEVITEYLRQIAKLNPSIKALRYISETLSLDTAKFIDSEIKTGSSLGRIVGSPYSAKDHLHVKGLPRSEGNLETLQENSTGSNSIISRLIDEGAICIGKANMAEYGKSYMTDNIAFGRTNNPFDLNRSPGGSGGGDAAAVASKMALFGVGADSGGSIRVPANFCGVFGLMPTRGSVSDVGPGVITHTITDLFRSNGIIARSLDDLRILYSIVRGYDPLGPSSTDPIIPNISTPTYNTKRFAYFTSLNGVNADTEIVNSLETTVKKFELIGLNSVEAQIPEFEQCYEIFIILAGQAALIIEDMVASPPRNLDRESPNVKNLRARIKDKLPPLTAERLLQCWYHTHKLRAQIQSIFTQYDFILAPVTATLPPEHGVQEYLVNDQRLESQQVFQFASSVNTLGLPAIAFPTELSKNNLPIGLQIIGPRYGELRLFKILEQAGFHLGINLNPK